jgi:hypothetical protein
MYDDMVHVMLRVMVRVTLRPQNRTGLARPVTAGVLNVSQAGARGIFGT